MNRIMLASEILKVAKDMLAMDFATNEALDKYMHDHPGAEKSNHHVTHEERKPHAVKNIQGVHPKEYAQKFSGTANKQLHEYAFEPKEGGKPKTRPFYRNLLVGKGGIVDHLNQAQASVKKKDGKFSQHDLDGLTELFKHAQNESNHAPF